MCVAPLLRFKSFLGFLEVSLSSNESCSQMKVLLYLLVVQHGGGGVRVFHEGLFWRCSFTAASDQYSILDLWICERFTAMRLLKTHLVMQHHNSILPPPPPLQIIRLHPRCAGSPSSSRFQPAVPPKSRMNSPLLLVGIVFVNGEFIKKYIFCDRS